jgi:Ca2+-binding RTX toxin-like protein
MLISKSMSQERRRRLVSSLAGLLMAYALVGGAGQAASAAVIGGTPGPDTLRGTMGDDQIRARAGADTVRAFDGHDNVSGGFGDDTIFMGDGRALHGFIEEGAAGGPGRDTIYGEFGKDQLEGGSGNDVLRGGRGQGDLRAGDGDDIVIGGPERDLLQDGRGDDLIRGGLGPDVLEDLGRSPGRDRLFMGAGTDRVTIDNDGQVDHIDCGRETDEVHYDGELDPRDVLVDCEVVTDEV